MSDRCVDAVESVDAEPVFVVGEHLRELVVRDDAVASLDSSGVVSMGPGATIHVIAVDSTERILEAEDAATDQARLNAGAGHGASSEDV